MDGESSAEAEANASATESTPATTERVTAPDTEYASERGFVIGSGRRGIQREIGHDEFDPVGTVVLIGIYMAIVVAMWIFMYFVEFLGGDLTVIG